MQLCCLIPRPAVVWNLTGVEFFYLFHMTSSPLRTQRKTENCHHNDAHMQGDSSFCGDVGKWKEVLVIYTSRIYVKQTEHHCYGFM